MSNTVIALKKSATPSAAPVDLANGELAINYADGKLFYKHANGTIAAIEGGGTGGDSFGTINANGTLIVADTPGDILTIEAGTNVTITADAINDKITISASGGISDLSPALIQANNARDHANAAFASANAGQATANAAFDKANSANITADRAFNHANAAFITANVAFANANTVMISAQAAFTVANSGFLHANSGYAFANSIAITANLAFAHANAAFANGNVVIQTAQSAFTQANVAVASASAGQATANAAFARANLAHAHANASYAFSNSAHSIANLAFIHANAAFLEANTAEAIAIASFIQANTARVHANAAFASSNSVNTYSDSTYVKLSATSQTITGNVNIVGDLTLSGNTFTIDATRLEVDDPLIYLAANNYTSDIVDIGFIANYVNATGQNVHTGLYREHEDKMYYLFQGYDKEPINNHLGALSNNMTLAVLNADLRTSNLVLGGANAILTIGAAFNKANSTTYTSNVVISVADNTNAALRITQTGTGDAIRVEDSANPDATCFIVDANGSVGIGTQTPATQLHQFSATAVSRSIGTGTIFNLEVVGGGVVSYGPTTNHPLNLVANNATVIRLDTSGNVLIGRTTSTVGQNVKLDVNGAINASAVLVNGAPALTGGITSNVVISVADNTNAALRITQTGNGEAIRVEDNANPDATPFVVDANGKVGIGRTATTYALSVQVPTTGPDGVFLSGPTGTIAVHPSSGPGNYNALVSANDQTIIFYGGSSTATVNTGNLVIAPWGPSSGGMKIDYNGNVFIGRKDSTVGQNVKLDVNGAINASAVLINGNPALPNTSGVSFNGNLNFPTGNVGIGTTTPGFKLDVIGTNATQGIRVYNTEVSGSNIAYFMAQHGAGSSIQLRAGSNYNFLLGTGAFPLYIGANNGIHMTVASSGNIGIGTTNPVPHVATRRGLIISDTANDALLEIHGSGGSKALFQAVAGHTYVGSLETTTASAGALYFTYANGTAGMVLTGGGNLGVGTLSPNYKLEVAGSFAAQTKSFVINHPTKPGMMLRHGSLEGPENGVYVRGRLDGKSIIELPDYWWNLIDESTITVNLTPIGRSQDIWVQSVSAYFIHLNQPAECFFTVFAERKDVDKLVVEY